MITPRYYFSEDFRKYENILRSINHTVKTYRKGDVLCDVDSILYFKRKSASVSASC